MWKVWPKDFHQMVEDCPNETKYSNFQDNYIALKKKQPYIYIYIYIYIYERKLMKMK